MTLTLDQAREITDRRNEARLACDAEAFLGLWTEDCVVEGPEHYLEGELGAAMKGAGAAMKPIYMLTRSLAVEANAMYYEFAIVWETRSTGQRLLSTGMTGSLALKLLGSPVSLAACPTATHPKYGGERRRDPANTPSAHSERRRLRRLRSATCHEVMNVR